MIVNNTAIVIINNSCITIWECCRLNATIIFNKIPNNLIANHCLHSVRYCKIKRGVVDSKMDCIVHLKTHYSGEIIHIIVIVTCLALSMKQ